MSQMTRGKSSRSSTKHIVGQKAAKRAWRSPCAIAGGRQQVAESLRAGNHAEKHPHDRPDRCRQKPRSARRLARLAKAPFIKVEATKFTEVGYVGGEKLTRSSAIL